jgi:hypothetical protein
MPLPDLHDVCAHIEIPKLDLCVKLPGGIELCADIPSLEVPALPDLSASLMLRANAALAPLMPIFNLMDVVVAIVQCVKAIPDALGPPPDPTKITGCIPDMMQKLDKILALLPPLTVPVFVAALLDALIAFLKGLRVELLALFDAKLRIDAAGVRAAELGSAQLQIVVDCAQAHITAQLDNLGERAKPIERLLTVINLFLELAGQNPVPPLGGSMTLSLSGNTEEAVGPLDVAISQLRTARAAIPA